MVPDAHGGCAFKALNAPRIKSCSIHQSSLFSAASCCMKAENYKLAFYNLGFVCEQGWPGLGWVGLGGR